LRPDPLRTVDHDEAVIEGFSDAACQCGKASEGEDLCFLGLELGVAERAGQWRAT